MVLKAKGLWTLQHLAKDCSDLGYEVTPETWWFNSGLGITFPKTNMFASENWWLEYFLVSEIGGVYFYTANLMLCFLRGVD